MTIKSTMRLGAYSMLLSSLSGLALAQSVDNGEIVELAPIDVEREATENGATRVVIKPQGQSTAPVADAADLLRAAPGVSAGRMGGHGLEITIRGQQQNQLNVIDAGSFTFGACPNRMDPPTATAAIGRADRIVVERGYASVTHGAGGSGGTVILERDAPVLEDDKPYEFELSAGYASNTETRDLAAGVTIDMGRGFYLKGSAERRLGENYEDGSGNEIRGAYEQQSEGLTFGYAANGVDLALDIEHDKAKGILYPGAGMDSPSSETMVYRLRGGVDLDYGILRRIEGNLYRTEVDHVMDNYTLRPVGMMAARVPSTSDTTGGKLEAHLEWANTTAKVGVDLQSNNRQATFYAGMPPMIPMVDAENPSRAMFHMWPDVTIRQTGLYAETETELNERTVLKLGARYDYVKASAKDAALVPGGSMMTPNNFYNMQYGTDFNDSRDEHNFSGLIRLEHEVAPGTKLMFGLSRSVRTADATERAIARVNWVGNPDIKPEKHHQLDLGLEVLRDNWGFNASLFADRVDDYILRDAFTVPGVTTYRNVRAQLAGLELSGAWERNGFELGGDISYTYGENLSDDRALAQIAPLQGQVSMSYGQDLWRAGARVNFAAKQKRIDPSRDAGETPGYATLDLFGSYQLGDNAVLYAGVNNVMDKTYANHLSRANVFDPTLTQVNEPGRTLYIKLEARF